MAGEHFQCFEIQNTVEVRTAQMKMDAPMLKPFDKQKDFAKACERPHWNMR